jgi:hypothetical protein
MLPTRSFIRVARSARPAQVPFVCAVVRPSLRAPVLKAGYCGFSYRHLRHIVGMLQQLQLEDLQARRTQTYVSVPAVLEVAETVGHFAGKVHRHAHSWRRSVSNQPKYMYHELIYTQVSAQKLARVSRLSTTPQKSVKFGVFHRRH